MRPSDTLSVSCTFGMIKKAFVSTAFCFRLRKIEQIHVFDHLKIVFVINLDEFQPQRGERVIHAGLKRLKEGFQRISGRGAQGVLVSLLRLLSVFSLLEISTAREQHLRVSPVPKAERMPALTAAWPRGQVPAPPVFPAGVDRRRGAGPRSRSQGQLGRGRTPGVRAPRLRLRPPHSRPAPREVQTLPFQRQRRPEVQRGSRTSLTHPPLWPKARVAMHPLFLFQDVIRPWGLSVVPTQQV